MGMVAILVMWPGPFEQIFIPPSHRSSIWNFDFDWAGGFLGENV